MNSSQIKMRRLLHPNRVAVRTNDSRAAALLDFFAYHPRTSRLRHTKQSTCAKLWLTTFAPCKVPTYWWLKRQHRLSVLPVFFTLSRHRCPRSSRINSSPTNAHANRQLGAAPLG